jgi:hypothetical protein
MVNFQHLTVLLTSLGAKKTYQAAVTKRLTVLRPLLRFLLSSHHLGRPSQRQIRRADEKDDAHARVRVLNLEVEIESLPRDISTSIQQYQVVELGSPQISRCLEAIGRIDLNAATA